MSLEKQIETLNNSILKLIEVLSERPQVKSGVIGHSILGSTDSDFQKSDPTLMNVTQSVKQEPVAKSDPVSASLAMPATPSFIVAPVTQSKPVPFNNPQGLIAYVMEVYKEIGQEKGSRIHNWLIEHGYQNINEVTTEQYPKLYEFIESLRV